MSRPYMPRRSKPSTEWRSVSEPRAKPVLAWGIVHGDGRLALIAFPSRPHEEMLLPGERIVRVEIREIEEKRDDQ